MDKHYVDKIELSCEKCGGVMVPDYENNIARCPYCENTAILVENESIAIAQIELAQQELELTKQKLADEKREEERLNKTRKSFMTILMLVFMVISIFFAYEGFSEDYGISAGIAVLQAVLFLCAWLIRMQIIKGAKRRIHTLITIISFILIVPFIACMDIQTTTYEKYVWPNSELCALVPLPELELGEVRRDTPKRFEIMLGKANSEYFNSYIEECKNLGFIYEQNRYDDSFSAYNEDGTLVSLRFADNCNQMYIDLTALPDMTEYFWNERGIAGLLPKPKSEIGYIEHETSTSFNTLIANTDKAAFVDYVYDCKDAGFNIDESDYGEFFAAYNADGYSLSVTYERNNIMKVFIYMPNDYSDE